MAFKLTAADKQKIDEMLNTVRSKHESLCGAIDTFNQEVDEAREKMEEHLNDLNGALSDLRDFISEKHADFEGQYDDKSEKWQEGERGSATLSWIETFDIELNDVELNDLAAEDVSHPELDELDAVENLESEPSY